MGISSGILVAKAVKNHQDRSKPPANNRAPDFEQGIYLCLGAFANSEWGLDLKSKTIQPIDRS